MNSGNRRAMTGSIHRIREFELEKVNLVEEFDILQIVGEGWFGKILLVEHRATDTEMVLKALPKPYVSIRDFYREFHYGLHLSAHRNIVTTYDVAFETAGFYVFSQEYAPLGDLTSNLLDTGIGELHTKRVAKQLAAALDHLHTRELIHRDVKLDNILIFKSDFSRIKLCDFGETRKAQSMVRRRNEWLPYSPPEILNTALDNSYRALVTHDIWQFGIVIFICLTGCLPWQKASLDDPRYFSYFNWYNSSNPLKKQPKLFKMVSSKAQKMFKKFIEPRPERRATNLNDLQRFLDDRWMAKGYGDRVGEVDVDELCPSMYSFHSDVNEKNKLLKHFLDHGIETTVDRKLKKQRIRDWIQSSVIAEEREDEEDDMSENQSRGQSPASEMGSEIEARNHPIEEKYQRNFLRYADEKHINPRTGEVIQGIKHEIHQNNQLSYDVQNLQPVVDVNVTRKTNNKEENISQSSTKDSAYGSLDFKSSNPSNNCVDPPREALRQHNAQSRSLQGSSSNINKSRSVSNSSMHQNISPNSIHDTRFQAISTDSSKGSLYTPTELRNSTSILQGSTTTLRTTDSTLNFQNSSQNKSITNGYHSGSQTNAKGSYISLKDSAYDSVALKSNARDSPQDLKRNEGNMVEESPYSSMINIVQGQMKINPYTSKDSSSKQNVVNVSVVPYTNR